MKLCKIKKFSLIHLILAVSPFAYWLDRLGLNYLIVGLFTFAGFLLLLKLLVNGRLVCSKGAITIITISAVVIFVYVANWLLSNPDKFYYTRFFLMPFFFIILFGLRKDVTISLLLKFIQYLIVVNFIVCAIEAFLVNCGFMTIDLFPVSHQMVHRTLLPGGFMWTSPYGLTGNFSVNGTSSVIFGLLYYAFARINKQKPRMIICIFAVLSVFISASGQAFGTLFGVMILYYLTDRSFLSKFIAMILVCLVSLLALSGIFYRFSLQYFIILYNMLMQEHIPRVMSNLNIRDVWFGSPSPDKWSIDLSFLFVIGNYGIIYFCLYWAMVFCGFLAYKNKLMLISAIAIFLGSLHYPISFYFHIQLLIVLVIVVGFSYSKSLFVNKIKIT